LGNTLIDLLIPTRNFLRKALQFIESLSRSNSTSENFLTDVFGVAERDFSRFSTCNPNVDAIFGVTIERTDANLLRVELVA
jgi:hypothetical protein